MKIKPLIISVPVIALILSMSISVPTHISADTENPPGEGLYDNIITSVEKLWTKSEWQMLALTNQSRISYERHPYSTFDKLQQAANVRAEEIAKLFSHTRPDGRDAFSIFEDFNIFRLTAGENIATGHVSPEMVMHAWLESPGHKDNILADHCYHMGSGYTKGGAGSEHNWVQLFVGGCKIEAVSVGTLKANPMFFLGKDIETQGLILILSCKHGSSYMPLTDVLCSGYDKNLAEPQTVTVSYAEKETSFSFTLLPSHTLKLNTMGGKPVEDITDILKNSVAEKPANPVRKGYKFLGWYADKEYKEAWDWSSAVNEDATLYAKWKGKTIKLTFRVLGGRFKGKSKNKKKMVIKNTFGKKIKLPPKPKKKGYIFSGWLRTNYTGGIVSKKSPVPAKKRTYIPNWIPIDFLSD